MVKIGYRLAPRVYRSERTKKEEKMLKALDTNGKVVCPNVDKSTGPFFCIGCDVQVSAHNGRFKQHFQHMPETNHDSCKSEAYHKKYFGKLVTNYWEHIRITCDCCDHELPPWAFIPVFYESDGIFYIDGNVIDFDEAAFTNSNEIIYWRTQ